MITNLFIPKLGMTMEKATIAEWRFNDGDHVELDSVILVIDTEKVANDIEAPAGGKLVITAAVGEELPCGAIIGYIVDTQEEYAAVKGGGQIAIAESVSNAPAAVEVQQPAEQISAVVQETVHPSGERIKISPLAKVIAEQNNIDISKISGTGPGERIVKYDVEMAMLSKPEVQPVAVTACPGSRGCAGNTVDTTAKTVAPAARPEAHASSSDTQHEGKKVREIRPLKGMRKAISDHMHHSHSITAPISVMYEIDMTEMISFRTRLLAKAKNQELRLTYTDIFIMIIAKALKKAPQMNSSLINNEIIIWDDINIGFGVSVMLSDGENGLVVPVIRNADKMSLGEITAARKDLVDKARLGKLSVDEMSGGTFTFTNTAALSPYWHIQTPMIHQPQAGIFGAASIVDRPVVKDGAIVIRPIMPVYLTFDHRIVDGGGSSVFNNEVFSMMSDPDMIFL